MRSNIVSYILLFHRLVVVVVWVLSIFLAVPIILTKVLGIAIDNDKKTYKYINTLVDLKDDNNSDQGPVHAYHKNI